VIFGKPYPLGQGPRPTPESEEAINPLTLIRVARSLLSTSYDFVQQGNVGRAEAIADLQEAQGRITRAIGILRADLVLVAAAGVVRREAREHCKRDPSAVGACGGTDATCSCECNTCQDPR
jgi:hypothetical protein